jgi:T-complex protein 1 subunit alpha
MEGDESVDASVIGSADEVVQERICDDELILIRGPKARTAASIIIRGANDFMCDEIERSVHDALCVVKRVLESKQVVPGGGCCEAALSIYLENYATTVVRFVHFKSSRNNSFDFCVLEFTRTVSDC